MGDCRGVNHIGFLTNRLDETVRFYTEILGLKLLRSGIEGDVPGRHCFLDIGGSNTVVFFESERELEASATGSFHHLAITLETVEELEQRREWLLMQGVDATDIHHQDFIQTVHFRDPNGILLEYAVYVRDFDESDLFLDPSPPQAVLDHRAKASPDS